VEGGCIEGRKGLAKALICSICDGVAPVPLCAVPKDCVDARVQNASDAVRTAYGDDWLQPGGFSWRVCETSDVASDECDPSVDATRDNALAFVTVFAVQCTAIALGHVVMMWKLRRMVRKHRLSRLRSMGNPRLEKQARRRLWIGLALTYRGADQLRAGGSDLPLCCLPVERELGVRCLRASRPNFRPQARRFMKSHVRAEKARSTAGAAD
jgi:hypothetical protein